MLSMIGRISSSGFHLSNAWPKNGPSTLPCPCMVGQLVLILLVPRLLIWLMSGPTSWSTTSVFKPMRCLAHRVIIPVLPRSDSQTVAQRRTYCVHHRCRSNSPHSLIRTLWSYSTMAGDQISPTAAERNRVGSSLLSGRAGPKLVWYLGVMLKGEKRGTGWYFCGLHF